jgi:hypothetical protein
MPAKEEASAMSTSEFKLTFDAVYYHVTDIEKSIALYRVGLAKTVDNSVDSDFCFVNLCEQLMGGAFDEKEFKVR